MQFTRGDTFEFSGPVTATVNGTEITDLTDWEAACQIRTEMGGLVADLEVTWLARSPAQIRIKAPGSTQGWPPGKARFDIQFTTPDGRIVSTRPAAMTITQDVTR